MSRDDEVRWDTQHAQSQVGEEPASFLRQMIEADAWPVPRGRALDLACGKGRNALYLAELGFEVVAMDISSVALAAGRSHAEAKRLTIDWQQVDLEQVHLGAAAYQLIVSFNYLQRSLMPQIKRAVKIGGYVIYETYLIDQKEIGQPKNPAYLLGHNELLKSFDDFRVLSYREGKFPDAGGGSFRAGIVAQRLG
ncbi:MAG: methyltransferase domain-containing protein [Deltaproteobacteria bacterium]|nr:methyltransferase domain-containing protein [Deltaproteobacteria bacterium]